MHDLALRSSGDTSGAGDACLFGLSLCSGAGGLDLGLAIAIPGYRAVGHVERETFAAATLVARMEDASLDQAVVWDDVGTFDGGPWRGAVDIVTAGYPCQPFSVAGKRRGTDDPRHLWPHVARIIGEVEPPFVFLENVAHHLRLGFPEVAAGLVRMGYKLAAGLFTAAEVGAPHRRERLFILAIREGDELADPARLLWDPFERRQPDGDAAALADTDGERRLQAERGQPQDGRSDPFGGDVDDADGPGPQGWRDEPGEHAGERPAWPPGPGDASGWRAFLRHAPDLTWALRCQRLAFGHMITLRLFQDPRSEPECMTRPGSGHDQPHIRSRRCPVGRSARSRIPLAAGWARADETNLEHGSCQTRVRPGSSTRIRRG
ncbi:DNA cytosine methyltransferase [Roseovarius sp. MBR-38]